MPDFTSLLSKPVADVKRPEALPAGIYPGVIKGYELGDQNKNKTPYVRFSLGLTGWPEGAEAIEGVDLSHRSLRRDYFLTEDALWRLKDLMESLGIKAATFADGLPETQGASVQIEVQQYMSQQNDIGNQVGAVKAA